MLIKADCNAIIEKKNPKKNPKATQTKPKQTKKTPSYFHEGSSLPII